MERNKRLSRLGTLAFFFSGICAISSGVVVSILQEQYGFSYGTTGTLISLMSIGNLVASFAAGVLPSKIGARNTVLILCSGYTIGYLAMGSCGAIPVLAAAFALLGLAKGCALNNCTVLVGNHSADRTRGLNLMHAGYACGALLCPLLIMAALQIHSKAPTVMLALFGASVWGVFAAAKLPGKVKTKEKKTAAKGAAEDRAFLRQKKFWLLTCLLFCQIAAEGSVTGWLVTYYKGNGLLSGTLSTYTVTVMWGATLIGRLLIAFVFPIKKRFPTLACMGAGCTILYIALLFSKSAMTAILLLFLFAFAMAGVNPTVVAGAGNMLSAASMGVMLPIAGAGAIIMPWVIGIVAEHISLQAGMFCNVVPCLGILVFSLLCRREERAAIPDQSVTAEK